MASSNSTPDKLPNGSKSPLSGIKQETVECLSCGKNFYREKTNKFTLIACPYCGCPHSQGAFFIGNETFLKQKQINAKAEVEVQKKQEKNSEDWAEWIKKLVEHKISDVTRKIEEDNKGLREKIEKLQKQLQESKPNEQISETSNQVNQELLMRLDRLEEQLHHQYREHQATHQQIYRYERQILDLSERLAKISQIQQKHEALLDKPVAVSDVSKPELNLIPVDMTEETVHNCLNNNRDVILFQNKGTGRYWVKPMQDGENDTKIYYLVCKKTVKFTLESLTLVQSCFEFENPDAPSSQVEITLPAIVSLSGPGNTWQLVKCGKLSFIHPLGES